MTVTPVSLFVLVVEDHLQSACNLAVLLRHHGHEVFVARDGDEALRAARVTEPDVIVLDVGLPGEDGYQVARKLCVVARKRPLLIAVTGYCGIGDRSRMEGFDHHFLKPADPEELAEVLARHAERLAEPRGAAGLGMAEKG